MGQYEQITESELKQSIREFLQQIIAENQAYIGPLLKIRNQLSSTSKQVRIANKFSTTLQEKGYSYYALELSKESQLRLSQMSELYHYYNEITTKMLGLNKLTYSIYYKTDDGKILRIQTSDVSKATSWMFQDGPSNQFYLKGHTIKQVFAEELESIQKETEYTKELTSHYNALEAILKASYKGKSYQQKVGKYIPEAFERDVLNYPHTIENVESFSQHSWSLQEAWDSIRLSSGNAPWYSGGDVLSKMFNVQVKGFTGGGSEYNKKGQLNPFYRLTGLTTLRSLEDIANYLITLLDVTHDSLEEKVNEIYMLFNQEDWEHQVNLEIENDAEKITKKLIKQGQIPINFIY